MYSIIVLYISVFFIILVVNYLVETILQLISCHLIGDYVLQSEFLATTKGKNYYHLFVHCFLYCIPFCVVFGFSAHIVSIFVVHLIVDNLKARYNSISYAEDQLIHYLVLVQVLL